MNAELRIFEPNTLLPAAWRPLAAGAPVYTFNPSLLADRDGWLMAYRVVLADGIRRIALCRLDRDLVPVSDSCVPLSDHVRFSPGAVLAPQARTWFADPRLYRLAGCLYVHWNSGWHEPRNHQFLQELDPSTLLPLRHPREMLLAGPRQPIEKNWTLWGEGPFHATYSPSPHKILSFSLEDDGDLCFQPESEHDWDNRIYERRYGRLRGGSPPQRWDDRYFALCHSMSGTAERGYDYSPAVYAFEATAPFRPLLAPHRPLALPEAPPRRNPSLNRAVARVVYPCGLVRDDSRWLVSYGMNDELCAIAPLSHAQLVGTLLPLPAA